MATEAKRIKIEAVKTEFLEEAHKEKMKSEDPNCKVGAIVVFSNNEIGRGYNHMPQKLESFFPWEKNKSNIDDCKLTYVCHAELNAIVNTIQADIKSFIAGCTLEVSNFPCNECAKLIAQLGIKRTLYETDHKMCSVKGENDVKLKKLKASKRILDTAKITYERKIDLTPKNQARILDGDKMIAEGIEDTLKGESGNTYVIHSVMNAVINAKWIDLKDHTVYVTRFPCLDCAKIIVKTGIKQIYTDSKPKHIANEMDSKDIFSYHGVGWNRI